MKGEVYAQQQLPGENREEQFAVVIKLLLRDVPLHCREIILQAQPGIRKLPIVRAGLGARDPDGSSFQRQCGNGIAPARRSGLEGKRLRDRSQIGRLRHALADPLTHRDHGGIERRVGKGNGSEPRIGVGKARRIRREQLEFRWRNLVRGSHSDQIEPPAQTSGDGLAAIGRCPAPAVCDSGRTAPLSSRRERSCCGTSVIRIRDRGPGERGPAMCAGRAK